MPSAIFFSAKSDHPGKQGFNRIGLARRWALTERFAA
jgi:hypothetical protein